ncbi:MAG: MFS transporter [Ruminococcaceae bacterium]|nr:MFS transporter [Oscillospiraceae bacterium]
MQNRRNRLIFIVVYLAYTAIYIARVNLSMAGPELIAANVLSTAQMGLLGSVFSTVYAVGRLINGGLSDRTPPWVMLTCGLGVAGLSNLLVGMLPPFIGMFFLWTANAYAQSMLWSSVLCVVSSMYEKNDAKQKTSIMVTSVAAGNILGIVINTLLITRLGVRFAFVVPGILTVVLGALVFVGTRHINPPVQAVEKKHVPMWQLLKNRELCTMGVPAVVHGIMKENISLWMTVYMIDTYCVDLSTSAYYVLLIPSIGFVGRLVYPACYRFCRGNENTVSLVGFAVCALCAVPLFFGAINMMVSVLCLGLIYTAVSMINTSILSIYPLHYLKTGNVASVSGIMDFATYLGGGVASVIYGITIERFGYLPMFASWVVTSLISMVLIQKIKNDRKREEQTT